MTIRQRMWTFAAATAVAVAAATHQTLAQSTDKNPLAQVKAMKCHFTIYTAGSWKNFVRRIRWAPRSRAA